MSNWFGKSVLVISPAPTVPRDHGNRLRIARICERLKDEGAQIHFLLYPAEADWRVSIPLDAIKQMTAEFTSFHLVPTTRPLYEGPIGPFHQCDEWWDPAIGVYVDWLTRLQKFDAVIVNYTWLTKAFDHVPHDCLKILDTHDKFSGRKELFIANGLQPEFYYMTEEQEKVALDRADIVWAIKREEAEFFRSITDKSVYPVPHIDPFQIIPATPSEFLRVGLLGANNNINRANFETFLDDAIDFVGRTLSQFEIVVAGSICKSLRPRAEKFIRFMGFVDSTTTFYEAIDVVAIPMTFSTGLKIKTAEALAAGKPVLSLAHAFEGFIPTHEFHALADNASLLKAVDQLARDQNLVTLLGRRSAEVVELVDAEIRTSIEATSLKLPSPVRESCMIVVNFREMEKVPLIADHIFETADYLRNLFPITFVASADQAPNANLARQLRQYGSIVQSNEKPTVGGMEATDANIDFASWEDISASALGLWVTTMDGRRLAPLVRNKPVFVSIDCLQLANASCAKLENTALLKQFEQFGGHCMAAMGSIGSATQFGFASLCDGVVSLPFLRATHHARYYKMIDGVRRTSNTVNLIDSAAASSGVIFGGLLPVHADAPEIASHLMQHLMTNGVPAKLTIVGATLNTIALELCLRLGVTIEFSDAPNSGNALQLTSSDLVEATQNDTGWTQIWAAFSTGNSGIHPTESTSKTVKLQPERAMPVLDQVIDTAPAAVVHHETPKGIGFHRIPPENTTSGYEFYFSQILVYLLNPTSPDLFDAMLFNVRFRERDIDRVAIRFSSFDGNWRVTLRKEDSSSTSFREKSSQWAKDEWGNFVSYRVGPAGLEDCEEGLLLGDDAKLIAECLHAMATFAEPIQVSVADGVRPSWMTLRRVLLDVPEFHLSLTTL